MRGNPQCLILLPVFIHRIASNILLDGEPITHLPEYKRAKYLGRVLGPDDGNPQIWKYKRIWPWLTEGERTGDSDGALQIKKTNIYGEAEESGLRFRNQNEYKGGASFRRSKTGS